jgi:lysophospholipase L1-like esterase
MSRFLLVVLPAVLSVGGLRADTIVIDSMDELHFRNPKDKGRAELVEGHSGKAVRFAFDKGCQGTFFTSTIRGQPEWDVAAGISFWVRGDGSNHFGGLELIYDDDYSVRYDYMFPIKSTEWTKVTVPWRDLIPVLPGPKSRPLGTGNKPSKVSSLWFGKWWYWRDYEAHSFAIDDIRLENEIALDSNDYRPSGAPLERTFQRLMAGKPVTIVTMGDSLTDFQHWANREVSWPLLLKKQFEEKYGSKVTIHNPALGGTQLRQNLVLMPRWLAAVPEPDLVTICFGGNDWDAGMRGREFFESVKDAVDRVRRATRGKADILVLSTVPSVEQWTTRQELAEACRKAAQDRHAGLADTEKAFLAEGKEKKERLYVWDKVHLSPLGHELMVRTILATLAPPRDRKAAITHSFLACGQETFIVDGSGKTIWSYPHASRDGWVLANGNVLLALSKDKDYPGGAAVEVTRDGKKVFEFKGAQSEVNTVQPLDNGNMMLTEAGDKPRLLEVNRDGKVVVEVPLQAQTKDHHLQTRMARKLRSGHYLVPQLLDKVVREYTAEGKIVWEAKTPHWPFTAIRLDDGNTLINCTLGNLVIEVDRAGKTVWQVSNDDLPGKPINDACGGQRLPNGDTVITSHHATANQVKLLQVTRDKKIVWTYTDARPSGIHHFQVLDTNGKPLEGKPLR